MNSSIETISLESAAMALDLKPAGRQYRGPCPVHGGSSKAFSITEKDGRVVWHCHAGCDNGALYEAMRAAGVVLEREKHKKPAVSASERSRCHIVLLIAQSDAQSLKALPKSDLATLEQAAKVLASVDNLTDAEQSYCRWAFRYLGQKKAR